jgi:hypothetical protein
VVTTLVCFVVGIEVIGGHGPAYHAAGIDLLVVVGLAVVGALWGRGAAGPMRRWLSVVCGLQAVFCGRWLLSQTRMPALGWAVSTLPLAGYLMAIAAASSEIRAKREGNP